MVSCLLWPTLPHRCAVSRFLSIELRWSRCLCFIFQQRFVPSPLFSSQNRSIESAPPSSTTLPEPLTPTLHCYKKVNSTLVTLATTQPRLHFASYLTRAPHRQSSTRRHGSLSLSSHTHHPFTQRHPRWRTSRPYFAFWTTYRLLNSCKKIFWNP
jgi:hypothetical protein